VTIGLRALPDALPSYPSVGEPAAVPYGRFTVNAVPDGAVLGHPPLVLLSHGARRVSGPRS